MPKVSVIMPVYNTPENYLREAVESILSQTYSDFEFIIINDGSSNNAQEVILSYDDSRIVYVKNEQNIKLIKTLNKGLKLARGEYIVRMDSDDISVENRIEKSVEFMDKNPDVAAASSYAIGTPRKLKFMLPEQNEVIKPFLRYVANCIMHPAIIIRSCVLKKNNLCYDENYPHNEDYKLWISINEHAKLANIPEFLLIHRLHEKSVSFQHAEEQNRITQKIVWENLLADFAPKNKKLKQIASKIYNSEKLSLIEFYKVDRFLSKVVSKLYKIFTPDIYPYISNGYSGMYTTAALNTRAGFGLFALIWLSGFGKIIAREPDLKKNVSMQVIKQMENELGKN